MVSGVGPRAKVARKQAERLDPKTIQEAKKVAEEAKKATEAAKANAQSALADVVSPQSGLAATSSETTQGAAPSAPNAAALARSHAFPRDLGTIVQRLNELPANEREAILRGEGRASGLVVERNRLSGTLLINGRPKADIVEALKVQVAAAAATKLTRLPPQTLLQSADGRVIVVPGDNSNVVKLVDVQTGVETVVDSLTFTSGFYGGRILAATQWAEER